MIYLVSRRRFLIDIRGTERYNKIGLAIFLINEGEV